mgnify:CR=1 FL=1
MKLVRIFKIVLLVIGITLSNSFSSEINAQTKKEKVRLKASYTKFMSGEIHFDISAGAKVNRKNFNVSNIKL